MKKAHDNGAASARLVDVQEELCRDFAFPVLQWQAKYEGIYLLGTSIARPLISKACLQVAREVGADAYAHGATGKGNDQCRFQLAAEALEPGVKMIAPWRMQRFRETFPGRTEMLAYCEEKGIPVKATVAKPYSSDENCLHISYEAGKLEDLAVDGYSVVDFGMTVSPQEAPDSVETIRLGFESGVPVSLNGESKSALAMVKELNDIAGRNGIGRIDIIENRFVGMKSRGVYEAPGMTVLYSAHQLIEQLTLDRDLVHLRDRIAPEVAEMVYYGFWYTPKMDALMAFCREAQKPVTGEVTLGLETIEMPDNEPRFINRELSWLEFNQRVMDEGRDPAVPLLERLKFLAITSSNLDEFFMVRVGGLQLLSERNSVRTDPSGMTPDEQLHAIGERVHRMTVDQYRCLLDDIEPALAEAGIRRVRAAELTERQSEALQRVFDEELFGVLTPMAVYEEDEFPLLAHDTVAMFVRLAAEAGEPSDDDNENGDSRFAIIPFGPAATRFITLPSEGGYEYILLEEVAALYIQRFFPGQEIIECVPFRVTRNADLVAREDFAADMIAELEDVLRARKESKCVRLEIADAVTSRGLSFLRTALGVRSECVFALPGPLDLSAFFRFSGLRGFDDLRYDEWPPQHSVLIDRTVSMFDVIAQGDVLLRHPFESFDPVVRLIEEAASDPDVLAIKQTLYRTSRNSPIVDALMRAAEEGKSVAVIVELKARFDEARNIEWARNLERAGVQVIYGVRGLKTHAKLCVIIRREPRGIRRYAHFGTGNYNENTAKLYTDISLLTCNDELTADATSFFNAVTGFSQPQQFRKIQAAPLGLRAHLLEMIQGETARRKQGQPAGIMAKLNSLVDPEIIEALYAASSVGVTIRLNVRGICCLRPGVPGLSENITVVSIIDRLLEHSRIMQFRHGGDHRLFISSADWMPRNLDRRIELLVPVEDPAMRRRLTEILEMPFRDNVKNRVILPDGSYQLPGPPADSERFRSQEEMYRIVCDERHNMEIVLANPRGFCAGVNMAIDCLDEAIRIFGSEIYVYHEIVHNKHVVERFTAQGVTFVDSISEVPEGAVLLFSAHGVSPEIREQSKRRKLQAIDATCPLVTKVHMEAVRFARDGYNIVLIGHEGHDEVIGTMGEAPESITLVETPDEVDALPFDVDDKIAYLTQTTLSVEEAAAVIQRLRARYPKIVSPPKEDICYATTNRQEAVSLLADQADVVIVLGSQNSSNSRRLNEIGAARGVPSYLIDSADELDPEWFNDCNRVLITAGASAPEVVVQDCVEFLVQKYNATLREESVREENVFFPLPREMRALQSNG
eukprot:g10473.t1